MSTLLFLDFESYYDQDYSLSKMAPPNYILDQRWETIGCAAKINAEPSIWIDGPDFPKFLAGFDPTDTTSVTFNALFDNCILAWHYGFVPAKMLCSMRMAVSLRGHLLRSASLATVGKSLGVGTKGTTIENVRGLRRHQIMAQPGLWRAFQAYANNDNEMNAGIFAKLWPEFPLAERKLMDRVIRCAVVPQFVIDVPMLQAHLADLEADKAANLAAAGVTDAKELRSNTKFMELLRSYGIEPEFKKSATTGEDIPAFAKTDEFMSNLLEHDDPQIQALAAARLGERSTIEQKRGQRMLSIAQLPWENHYRDGNDPTIFWSQHSMPIPLRYCGAHTHRLSGDWLLNMQNLPAGRGKQKSKLRKALKAPQGHKVVAADLSQIECRINAFICGQKDLLALFSQGKDPYSVLASHIFGKYVDKNTDGGIPRFIGKGGELGLGFGCGDEKFYNMVVRQARTLGMDVKKLLQVWTPSLAVRSVEAYRTTHAEIRQAWQLLDSHLHHAWLGTSLPVRFGPVLIGHGYVEGPGGLKMVYGNPREENGELWFDYGKRTHRMYGPKFLENIVQFLARIVIMNAALRIYDRTKLHFALQEHDALAWIVPDAAVDLFQKVVKQELTRPPSWAKGLPMACDCGAGPSYGEAK